MLMLIPIIIVLAFFFLATERITGINKAAIAMFAGTAGWVLYVCYGSDFVSREHPGEYLFYLAGSEPTSLAVKQFISHDILLKYIGKGVSIVVFLLCTMTIVEILNNNGCFDFLQKLMRTRSSKKMVWMVSLLSFVISANLDNLTTALMFLVAINSMVSNYRERVLYGAVAVIATNCGGMLTVIGNTEGLLLWTNRLVTPTDYSMSVIGPCVLTLVLSTWWISRLLPSHVDLQWHTLPYRGDDTNLNLWQRAVMLIVGIGGLWFIPTFHSITQLPPFLGAGCVLSVLWVVNEIMNRKLMNVDQLIQRSTPRIMQYNALQQMLFVIGIVLTLGVAQEAGFISWLLRNFTMVFDNVWVLSVVSMILSMVLDNFATANSFFTFHLCDAATITNDFYYSVVTFSIVLGGTILPIGSVAGLAYLKMQNVKLSWYFKTVGVPLMIFWLLGLGIFAFNYYMTSL